MSTGEREWTHFKTDSYLDEFKLFVRSLYPPDRFKRRTGKANRWPERCDEWYTHATIFAYIKSGLSPNGGKAAVSEQDAKPGDTSAKEWEGPLWKERRITFLFEHLNILDTKLGMLLNFNSLLLIAVNILFGGLYNLVPKPLSTNAHILSLSGRDLIWTLAFLSVLFGAIWLLTTILCLLGERRLVWGNLGLVERGQRQVKLGSLKDASLLKAEEEHVQALVIAVVKRTNKFRVSSFLTIMNVGVLTLVFIVGLGFLGAVNAGFLLGR